MEILLEETVNCSTFLRSNNDKIESLMVPGTVGFSHEIINLV